MCSCMSKSCRNVADSLLRAPMKCQLVWLPPVTPFRTFARMYGYVIGFDREPCSSSPRSCLLSTAAIALQGMLTVSLLHLGLVLLTVVTMAEAVPRVLVYTATAGYRHDSIPTAIQVLGGLANKWNVSFAFSE